jgi:hypothetical protein
MYLDTKFSTNQQINWLCKNFSSIKSLNTWLTFVAFHKRDKRHIHDAWFKCLRKQEKKYVQPHGVNAQTEVRNIWQLKQVLTVPHNTAAGPHGS